ncbi:UDP-glucose 4-epimerase [Alkaliphilus metalliredigens QYMF]|uniref:UDP-glucose 4-epimerase n=1 Tax=Alkaliphilus metalliredigens (strain QYMF) TaxID=293826 RepID=A6TK16_ALKMQ|nr:UDP-glucose 4-epimerase GalE [Alkaliphilus metalliredigens]ABR46534.1 UDP-glucose 4-epimerase [Alkaliphilus metalliredigens QYMF]
MAVLVCGGAGYIGSHTVLALLKEKVEVIVLDNLSKGHREALPSEVKLYQGDLRDEKLLAGIFIDNEIDGVIHFAADSLVGESVEAPLKYYENNVYGSLSLLKAMAKHGVKKIVFSSTAAVYGEPREVPIVEESLTLPTNPYGETKLAVERMLKWAQEAHGIEFVVLRYFNAAGAEEEGTIGEDHSPESHLIPLVLEVALGKREKIYIFGEDYPTEDGTCVRDYIHVMDLADAHLLALKRLQRGEGSGTYNLGNGKGFSVQEVIETARRITGKPIPAEMAPRRAGDPAVLIASSDKARKELGWTSQYDSLEKIIGTAWKWHHSNPYGFKS